MLCFVAAAGCQAAAKDLRAAIDEAASRLNLELRGQSTKFENEHAPPIREPSNAFRDSRANEINQQALAFSEAMLAPESPAPQPSSRESSTPVMASSETPPRNENESQPSRAVVNKGRGGIAEPFEPDAPKREEEPVRPAVSLSPDNAKVADPAANPTVSLVEVTPMIRPDRNVDATVKSSGANQKLTSTHAGELKSSDLLGLAAKMESIVAERPGDRRAHLKALIVAAAAGLDERARKRAEEAPGSEPVDSFIVDTLVAWRKTAGESDRALAAQALLDPVTTLRGFLMRRSDLTIPVVALCWKVDDFGQYEPLPSLTFTAGSKHSVIVYCELANYESRLEPDGQYRTLLQQRTTLLTPSGQSVWEEFDPDIEDRSRTRRNDFFIPQLVTIPEDLSSGEYVLKVSIEDRIAHKAAENSVTIRIEPPQTVANAK
jgi:hypothetical protein